MYIYIYEGNDHSAVVNEETQEKMREKSKVYFIHMSF